MSAFELRSSLPCNPKAWEAETPEDWYRSYEKEKEIWFLAVLKLYVNPGPSHPRPPLNDLSRLLILHGLMSISWDMKRREQTALGESLFSASKDLPNNSRFRGSDCSREANPSRSVL